MYRDRDEKNARLMVESGGSGTEEHGLKLNVLLQLCPTKESVSPMGCLWDRVDGVVLITSFECDGR